MGACYGGKAGVAQILLDHGANPNLGKGVYTSPILIATRLNYLKTLAVLLKAPDIQVNVKRARDGATPLIHAALHMGPKATQDLLEAGADPNLVDHEDNTALIHAAWKGNPQVVKHLCDKGANVLYESKKRGFALTVAAKENNTECVDIIDQKFLPLFRALNKAISDGHTSIRDWWRGQKTTTQSSMS